MVDYIPLAEGRIIGDASAFSTYQELTSVVGKLLNRIIWTVVLASGLYALLVIYLGVDQLFQAFATFRSWIIFPVLLLTLSNYFLRYLKWSLYLKVLEISVAPLRNLTIFLGGLSMVVTPGKIGELLKSYLLKSSQGIAMGRTMPIVMAERITDLIALLLLMLIGAITFRRGIEIVLFLSGMVALFLVVLSSQRLSLWLLQFLTQLPGLRRIGETLQEFYRSMVVLFRPRPLAIALVLSVAAWFCECLGFYWVVHGFSDGDSLSLPLAVFIYSASTVGGLPTPGGLGLTDGGMTALLLMLSHVSKPTAGAATLMIRMATLWFAVVVGVIALWIFRKQVGLSSTLTEDLHQLKQHKHSDDTTEGSKRDAPQYRP